MNGGDAAELAPQPPSAGPPSFSSGHGLLRPTRVAGVSGARCRAGRSGNQGLSLLTRELVAKVTPEKDTGL
jgi:hypothetical protein